MRFLTNKYTVALLCTFTAAIVRYSLMGVIGNQAPFFCFMLSILASAWYGGLKPGLLATFLGVGTGLFMFVSMNEVPTWIAVAKLYLVIIICLVTGSVGAIFCELLHKANRRLKRAEEQARSVVDHVVDGVITINDMGIMETVNPAVEKLFGYTKVEMIGQNVRMLMPEPYHSEHDGYLANFLRTGERKIIGSCGREVQGKRKDESVFPMSLAVSQFVHDGRIYFTGIIRGITEVVQRRQHVALERERMQVFLAMLSHELRNPLSVISNGVQTLEVSSNAETCGGCEASCNAKGTLCNETLRMISRQTKHLTRLVDDLLDVTRITQGKIMLRKQVIDLKTVIHKGVEMARPNIQARSHNLSVEQPGDSIKVFADPMRLTQVINNLLNNAAKYTPPNGEIKLVVHLEENNVFVSVSDTGIGIASDQLEYIFDLFTQVDKSLDRSSGGLGIGLTLCKNIMQMHGGDAYAYSQGLGEGSIFTIMMPTVTGHIAAEPNWKPPQNFGDHRRILIIDDSHDAADSMAALLKISGYHVDVATNSRCGLAMAENVKPDIVLLDIGLPEMNGYEVAKRIRQMLGEHPLLIAVTGYGTEEDKREAKAAGFNSHLVKPVELKDLLAVFQKS